MLRLDVHWGNLPSQQAVGFGWNFKRTEPCFYGVRKIIRCKPRKKKQNDN